VPEAYFLPGVLVVVLVLSAVIDYRIQKIPNLITYPTMALAMGYHGVTNGEYGVYFSLMGLAIGLALLILPYILGGMGAGDAKLLGAIGAVIGPKQVFIAFLYSALVGGVYAVLLILIRRDQFKAVLKRRWTEIKVFALTRRYEPIPVPPDEKPAPRLYYGIVISVGTLIQMVSDIKGVHLISL
jgi:prepilin peptidase CpaA